MRENERENNENRNIHNITINVLSACYEPDIPLNVLYAGLYLKFINFACNSILC